VAEKSGTDEETVAGERQAVQDDARRRGFELLERGLSSLRRATGYRRQSATSLLREVFDQSLFPERIKPKQEIDLESIVEQLATKYVERERLREGIGASSRESSGSGRSYGRTAKPSRCLPSWSTNSRPR